ncbi:MAG: PD-(D/E)XK nuclease family protein, partial [Aeromicrobium sp.]
MVEPTDSGILALHDAYLRSSYVDLSELEPMDREDARWDEVYARHVEFDDAAAALHREHRTLFDHVGLVDEAMSTSARSLYAQGKRFGVSDIGGCRRYVQFLIDDEEFTDPRGEFLAAYVGTAVGDHLEQDFWGLRNPKAKAQSDVVVPVEVVVDGEVFVISIPGHPDVVEDRKHGNRVIDYKTKDGLGVAIHEDGELKHKFQITLYAKGLIVQGV